MGGFVRGGAIQRVFLRPVKGQLSPDVVPKNHPERFRILWVVTVRTHDSVLCEDLDQDFTMSLIGSLLNR